MFDTVMKALELVAKGWSTQRAPKKRAARALVRLHSTLLTCHEAYEAMRAGSPESRWGPQELHRRWAVALDDLVSALLAVHDTLQLFTPEIADEFRWYLRSEVRYGAQLGGNMEALVPVTLQTLSVLGPDGPPPGRSWGARYHIHVNPEDLDDPRLDVDAKALAGKLGEFITKHFTLDEVFGAQ